MEARSICWAIIAAATLSLGARFATPNFVVTAPTPEMAKTIAEAAERYREELAVAWLGKPLPQWAQPCPIQARVSPNLGSGGVTTFVFNAGHVYDWRMSIQGSYERILDSVLPHEVNHTVFASYFRRPLPRWADEGACTTVEHPSERAKQQQMLIHFLRNRRGISFSEMFRMKEYPSDMLPLYAQGHSLATYLISQGGRRKFLQFLADGMQNEDWTTAIAQHYSYQGLGDLQNQWLEWVKQGSPPLEDHALPGNTLIAQNDADKRSRPNPNLLVRGQSPEQGGVTSQSEQALEDNRRWSGGRLVPVGSENVAVARDSEPALSASAPNVMVSGRVQGWHPPRQDAPGSAFRSKTTVERTPDAQPMQVTRPQPPEQARQIILEWSRDQATSAQSYRPEQPANELDSIAPSEPSVPQPLREGLYFSGERLLR